MSASPFVRLTVKIGRWDGAPCSAPVAVSLQAPALVRTAQMEPGCAEVTINDLPAGRYRIDLALPLSEASCRVYAVHGMDADSCVDLEDCAEKHLEFILEQPYSALQCVGYVVRTGDRAGLDTAQGCHTDHSCDDSYRELASRDLAARCEAMKVAIRQAYKNQQVCTEANHVLKLFMVPEFYFQGGQSAYPMSFLTDLMRWMQEEICQEIYRDWLFVTGTFVGYETASEAGNDSYYIVYDCNIKDKNVCKIANIAIVAKGGRLLPYKMDRWTGLASNMTLKATLAASDLERIRATPSLVTVTIAGSVYDVPVKDTSLATFAVNGQREVVWDWFAESGREWCVDGRQGGALFKLDGIVFGLEICQDHGLGRIARYYAKTGTGSAMQAEPVPQVQLIPSAGMAIYKRSCVASLIFNTDRSHCSLQRSLQRSLCYSAQSDDRDLFPIEPRTIVPIDDIGGSLVVFDPQEIVG